MSRRAKAQWLRAHAIAFGAVWLALVALYAMAACHH
jgi:hypothetical protein